MSAAPKLAIVGDATEGPPPYDLEAEQAVLVTIVADPSALPKLDFLVPDHFYLEPHRRIFEACVDLMRERKPIDLVTVHGWLTARGRLAQVGGAGYLTDLAQAHGSVVNIRTYAISVHDMWRRRRVIELSRRAMAVAYTSTPDVQRFCDDTTKSLAAIGMQNPARPTETLTQVLDRILARAVEGEAETKPGESRYVPTGHHSLDRLLNGGMRRKSKTTIAAEKGGGKTSLALQWAIHAAKAGISVLFMSTELTRDEIMKRALCQETGVDGAKINTRTLSRANYYDLVCARDAIAALPLRVDDTGRLTVDQLRGVANAYAEESWLLYRRPLGLVVVDYVQRLQPASKYANREEREQIGYSTRELKLMAQELDTAVLEISQANPPIKEGRRIIRKHYGSSVIGKEADEEIFIVPDAGADPEAETAEMTLDVVKQRDGKLGALRATFRGAAFRFDDPNAPNPMACASRQWLDTKPEPKSPLATRPQGPSPLPAPDPYDDDRDDFGGLP